MGSKASVLLQPFELDELHKTTGFSRKQVLRLYSRFTHLDKSNNGYLSREDFLRIPELAINPLGERIVHAFFTDGNDGVNFKQFMGVLAIFRPASHHHEEKEVNSREEKLRFAFKLYDLDSDDKINHEELMGVLHMMVGANISEAQLASIADRSIAEADQNGDNTINFEEFLHVLEKVDVETKMSIRFLA